MASNVDIANLALTAIGANSILALEDQSKNARVISQVFDLYREAELRAHNWSFAIARDVLPALAGLPPFGFQHYYQLPPDLLRLIQAGQFEHVSLTNYRMFSEQQYRIEGDKIAWGPLGSHRLTMPATPPPVPVPLPIRYIRKVIDPTQFDSLFVVAFAARLALQICEQITGSSDKDKNAAGMYEQAIGDALKSNAIEKPPSPLMDGGWVLTRLVG